MTKAPACLESTPVRLGMNRKDKRKKMALGESFLVFIRLSGLMRFET